MCGIRSSEVIGPVDLLGCAVEVVPGFAEEPSLEGIVGVVPALFGAPCLLVVGEMRQVVFSCESGLFDYTELLTPCLFVFGESSAVLMPDRGVAPSALFAKMVDDLAGLRQFARQGFHRFDILYFRHVGLA